MRKTSKLAWILYALLLVAPVCVAQGVDGMIDRRVGAVGKAFGIGCAGGCVGPETAR